MASTLNEPLLHQAVSTIFTELVSGAEAKICWVLNPRDPGLLASLDRLSGEAASAPGPAGAASIAAHADHLRFGYSLLNRWAQGDQHAFDNADFGGSWKKGTVSDAEWEVRRKELRDELARAATVIATPSELGRLELTGLIAGVVHLAYHLGAMRQIQPLTRGPG